MRLYQKIRSYLHSFKAAEYANQFFAGTLQLKMYNGECYADALSVALDTYLKGEERSNKSELKRIVKDVIKSNLLFGFKPHEYFMYDLADKSIYKWSEYLAERDRVSTLHHAFGLELKAQLRDKWVFYQLARPFFKREIIHLTTNTSLEEFANFAKKVKHLFCKPTDGHMGIGIARYDIDETSDCTTIYHELLTLCQDWVVEECIMQGREMAVWNESSVNTIRFPAFYRNGMFTPYYPRIRTGRKGQIVDNVAQGGLVAFIDAKTGIINTDGFLKKNEKCICHPDSGIKFNGTAIPHWQELLEFAEELHKALPQHVYIAWDFAYSVRGWDIVEANWGQMDSTQMIIGHGIRKEFHELLGE